MKYPVKLRRAHGITSKYRLMIQFHALHPNRILILQVLYLSLWLKLRF